MTRRNRVRTLASFFLAGCALVATTGCDPRMILYFLQPYGPTVPPTGPSLKGKRVVIITHVGGGAGGDYIALDRDLMRDVSKILKKELKKIDIVDSERVRTWAEAHPNWTDTSEVAKAFEADVVVFLEVEEFSVQSASSPDLLQGNAKIHVMVHEMKYPTNAKGRVMHDQPKEDEEIFNDYCNIVFPKKSPIPLEQGINAGAFRTKFLHIAATDISWKFVEHAPEDEIQDNRVNGY